VSEVGLIRFTMPRIFIAGAFRASTPYEVELNIRRAEDLGILVARLGAVPVIFHTMYRHLQGAVPGPFIDEASLSVLSTCHAVAVAMSSRTYELSEGTTNDVRYARSAGKSVFFDEYPVMGLIKRHNDGAVLEVVSECPPGVVLYDEREQEICTVCDSGSSGSNGLRVWIARWKESWKGPTGDAP